MNKIDKLVILNSVMTDLVEDRAIHAMHFTLLRLTTGETKFPADRYELEDWVIDQVDTLSETLTAEEAAQFAKYINR